MLLKKGLDVTKKGLDVAKKGLDVAKKGLDVTKKGLDVTTWLSFNALTRFKILFSRVKLYK